MQAGEIGEGGEIFILDMGKPVKIIDVARDMIRLSGLRPDEDIQIHITGSSFGQITSGPWRINSHLMALTGTPGPAQGEE